MQAPHAKGQVSVSTPPVTWRVPASKSLVPLPQKSVTSSLPAHSLGSRTARAAAPVVHETQF